jgi:hypothetical protein
MSNEKDYEPFNLVRAKAGEPIMLCNGEHVTLLAVGRKQIVIENEGGIVGIRYLNGLFRPQEDVFSRANAGVFNSTDVVMAPKPKATYAVEGRCTHWFRSNKDENIVCSHKAFIKSCEQLNCEWTCLGYKVMAIRTQEPFTLTEGDGLDKT